MKKKDNIYVLGLCLFIVLAIIIFLYPGKMYGSTIDWISQHAIIPDYFRTLFYDTKQLFPSFAMNIGGGQNIYNLSYYGYLNPIILFSYFLPFIKMIDYIMISSLLCILISTYLFYRFLKSHNFSSFICMLSTFIFICSAPLLFHSHRHIMFVNYMPFLLLGLMGIDWYFQKDKKWLYTLSVFLMIMTSYYFSVGGLLVLVIYGVYTYLKDRGHITLKQFLIDGIKFLIPMFIGILMSSVFLLPTAYSLLHGRTDSSVTFDIKYLFTPELNLDNMLYSNYSLGLTAISLLALFIFILQKKKENIFLGISLLLVTFIPIFLYLLNGTIYIRAKALIPFLPLFCMIIANYISYLETYKISLKKHFIIVAIILVSAYMNQYNKTLIYYDIFICLISVLIYLKFKKKIILIPMFLIAIIPFTKVQLSEEYVLKPNYDSIFSEEKKNLITETIDKDHDFYRFSNLNDTLETINYIYHPNYYQTSIYSSAYNSYYQEFAQKEIGNAIPYRNELILAQSNNIMFQKLMGVRYVLSKIGDEPIGYELISKKGEYGVYKNSDVLSLGYSTSNLMSKLDYESSSFPYKNEILLRQIVVDKEVSSKYKSNIKKTKLNYEVDIPRTVSVDKNDMFSFYLSEKSNLTLHLSKPIIDKILFIKFDLEPMDCKIGDLAITINGIKNNLTCKQWIYYNDNTSFEYTISSNKPINELSITLNKGIYDLENLEIYELDYFKIESVSDNFDLMKVDMNNTKGDVIVGNIDVKEDGYFASTIPYDEGFTVYVDEKKQTYEIVNKAFIGFPIKAGEHSIKFVYEAPWLYYGKIGSGIGIILFSIIIWFDKRKLN